ncbi:MAG: zinc ribbon domain-containing protein, partial [Chloroflexi bacterium]|nr:zinc ribbon domain-containing protein [Chloroflexota bacterium]
MSEMPCRACGQSIAAGARFCPYCAAPQTGAPPRRAFVLWAILAGAVVVVLVLAAGWMWLRGRPEPQALNAASETPAAVAAAASPIPDTPLPSPSPTPLPMPTSTPTATPRPLPTPANAYPLPLSPDGKWAPFEANGQVIFQGINGVEWRLPVRDYVEAGYLVIERWSQDGRYVYFSVHYYIDGGWALPVFGLHRLDLTTGNTEAVLTDLAFLFALSPDESAIAYVVSGEEPPTVHVIQLHSNRAEQAYPIRSRYATLGRIAWSPDQQQLAITAGGGVPGEGFYSDLILLNLSDGSQRDLVKIPRGILFVEEWTPEGYLKLLQDGMDFGWLEISSGVVTPVKPSSSPASP